MQLPPNAAIALLLALWPLCRVKREFQDCCVLVLRKVWHHSFSDSLFFVVSGVLVLVDPSQEGPLSLELRMSVSFIVMHEARKLRCLRLEFLWLLYQAMFNRETDARLVAVRGFLYMIVQESYPKCVLLVCFPRSFVVSSTLVFTYSPLWCRSCAILRLPCKRLSPLSSVKRAVARSVALPPFQYTFPSSPSIDLLLKLKILASQHMRT